VDVSGLDRRAAEVSLVAGVRYLTTSNTTIVADVYRNGSGFHGDEMRTFYDLVDSALAAAAAVTAPPSDWRARQPPATRNGRRCAITSTCG
jgi:hypothetical protein